jgi:CBS-domain-containing membrane protein
VDETASLEQIADTLQKHGIKRVPVLGKGKLVGIVSRADLLRGLVARQSAPAPSIDDEAIKTAVEAALAEAGVRAQFLSVLVTGGVVHMSGAAESDGEKRAAHVAAESVPGVKGVRDNINVLAPGMRTVMWGV